MKKIAAILMALLISAIIACSGSSSSSTEVGYVDPGLDSVKQLITNKKYSFSDSSISSVCPSCGPSDSCSAIIFSGTLSDVAYSGVAVGLDATHPNFSMKVYWPGSIDTSGSDITYSSATVKINSSSYTGNVVLNITTGTTTANDSTSVTYYTIVFKSDITTTDSLYTIKNGDTIVAYKY